MGKQWPHEEVPEGGRFLFPDGPLTVRVLHQEDGETTTGKFSIVVESRVVAPKQYRNLPFNFSFVIGTDDDPEADEPETWKNPPSIYSAGRYRSYLKAAGIPDVGDTDEEAEGISKNKPMITIDIGHHEDKNNPGRIYNDTNAFYAADSESRAVTEPQSVKPQQRQRKAASAATAKESAPPVQAEAVDDDDEWND